MKSRLIFLLAVNLLIFLVGCVAPSTVLVNRQGNMMRCAESAWGYGLAGAIAISSAQVSHDRCVADMRLAGYVPIPRVQVGIRFDTKQTPSPITELGGNAKDSGLKLEDLLISLDDIAIKEPIDVFRALENKSVGDVVQVKVRRRDETLIYPVAVTARN